MNSLLTIIRANSLAFGLVFYLSTTLISMAAMSIGTGVLLLCVALNAGLNLRATYLTSRDNRIFLGLTLILALSCGLSLIVARLHPIHFSGSGPEIHWATDLFKLWYFAWPFFLAGVLLKLPREKIALALQMWIYFAAAMACVGIIQFFTGWPRPQPIPKMPGYYHATLFLGHHLSTASIFIFPFFVGLTLAKCKKLWAATILIGVVLFLTWSRMLWIALPIGLGVWSLRRLANQSKSKIALTLLGALMVVGALVQVPQIQTRMNDLMGTAERFELWKANLVFFEYRPWTGIGWRKSEGLVGRYFQQIDGAHSNHHFFGHAHNNLLEMLAGTGLIGALAWLAWCFWVFRMSWRASIQGKAENAIAESELWRNVAWGVFCAWVVFQINGLTQVNFWEGKVMHQVMWSLALLLYAGRTLDEGRQQV